MRRLTAIVLGSAAGGGFPQWNCRCDVCRLAWAGDLRVKPRMQASLAVSVDGLSWTLVNAPPDLRAQIAACSALHPREGLRDSPIRNVILTGAEVDQVAGLLHLRERQPFTIMGTPAVLDQLAANPIFNVLSADLVIRQPVAFNRAFELPGDLAAELFPVPGKVPLYNEGAKPGDSDEGINVGVELQAGTSRMIYVPGAAAMTPALQQRFARADVLLFDGTLYTDDEMISNGTGEKNGRRMGHMPMRGADGSLELLAELPGRRIYTHINNTNRVLIDGSQERAAVETAGWEIAFDGMELSL